MTREVAAAARREVVRPDGAVIQVQEWGDPAGEPILLLHGALSTAEQNYRLVLAALGQKHRLVGLDLRGHGGSSNPSQAFDLPDLRDDALAVLEGVAVDQFHEYK